MLTAMPSVEVIPATPADEDRINALLTEARDWLHAKGVMQWTEGLLPIRHEEFFVTREQGQIVGTFRLVWTDEDGLWGGSAEAGYVGKLVVCRSSAGRGLGLGLLRAAEGMVVAAGRKWLRLDCWTGNSRLISYYEAAGFRRCGTGRCMGHLFTGHHHAAEFGIKERLENFWLVLIDSLLVDRHQGSQGVVVDLVVRRACGGGARPRGISPSGRLRSEGGDAVRALDRPHAPLDAGR
jgi:predicted N-acetyltransferase YhbS